MQLQKGSKGSSVKQVQEVLRTLGYSISVADGDFGPETEKAVVAYQKKKHLQPDGVVGPITWANLVNDGLKVPEPIKLDPVLVKKFIGRLFFRAGEFEGYTETVNNAVWDDPDIPGWQKATSDKLVKYMLKVDGWEKGAAYCAAAVGTIIMLALEDCNLPIEKFLEKWTAHVMTNVRFAQANDVLSSFPSLGSVWLARFGSTDSGHTGLVIDITGDMITNIEGNTVPGVGSDSEQRSGDGFYKRKFHKKGRGSLYTQGFISAENILRFYIV